MSLIFMISILAAAMFIAVAMDVDMPPVVKFAFVALGLLFYTLAILDIVGV